MRQAILVIDWQVGLIKPSPQPFETQEVTKRINLITKFARSKNIPVIFIQHEVATGDVLRFNTDSWHIHPDLTVEETDIYIRKTTPDSFLRTNLHQTLQDKNITDLLICGYATEFCVDTTIRSSAAHGYNAQLISDAHTTHDKPHADAAFIREHHNQTLPNITSFGARISTVKCSELLSVG